MHSGTRLGPRVEMHYQGKIVALSVSLKDQQSSAPRGLGQEGYEAERPVQQQANLKTNIRIGLKGTRSDSEKRKIAHETISGRKPDVGAREN